MKKTSEQIKPGVFKLAYDFPKLLEKVTGKKNWKEINGPDSGCGLDYWYKSGKCEAYINLDQGWITVSIDDEVVFEGRDLD